MNRQIAVKTELVAIPVLIVRQKLDFFQKLIKRMELSEKIIGVVLFILILGCGTISTLCLLLLATNVKNCNNDSNSVQVSTMYSFTHLTLKCERNMQRLLLMNVTVTHKDNQRAQHNTHYNTPALWCFFQPGWTVLCGNFFPRTVDSVKILRLHFIDSNLGPMLLNHILFRALIKSCTNKL